MNVFFSVPNLPIHLTIGILWTIPVNEHLYTLNNEHFRWSEMAFCNANAPLITEHVIHGFENLSNKQKT